MTNTTDVEAHGQCNGEPMLIPVIPDDFLDWPDADMVGIAPHQAMTHHEKCCDPARQTGPLPSQRLV